MYEVQAVFLSSFVQKLRNETQLVMTLLIGVKNAKIKLQKSIDEIQVNRYNCIQLYKKPGRNKNDRKGSEDIYC